MSPRDPLPLSLLPTQPGEEWRYLPWDDSYAVSSHGRICRTTAIHQYHAGRLLRPRLRKNTVQVLIAKQAYGLARLVASVFHGAPPDPRMRVMHRDGDPANLRADNLVWATPAEIVAGALDRGTWGVVAGELSGAAKLTTAQAQDIRRRYAPNTPGLAARLAGEYGVSVATIRAIGRGRRWQATGEPRALDDE